VQSRTESLRLWRRLRSLSPPSGAVAQLLPTATAVSTLPLQMYTEPFVTTRHFLRYRALSVPRASAYDARFRAVALPPDGFNTRQFRSNTVVRWEYRPGSALLLVWAHGRD
jgi:hypothetical protein